MVKPILKWAGGKRQLLPEITARFPQSYEQYHEPFIGGGAVFLNLEPDRGTINDINSKLIDFYTVVKESPDQLIEKNKHHEYDEEYYYDARTEFNKLIHQEELNNEARIRKASLLLYLNRAGYNGLFRENSDGEFNVPFGRHTNPDFVQQERILAAGQVLEDIDIYNEDFEYIREQAEPGDLIYFDPPYEPVSKTADFTQYSADGFSRTDQKRLRDTAVALNRRGVHVIISNSPPVAELYESYDSFQTDYVEAVRMINRDSESRDEVAEVLISNVHESDRRRQTLDQFSS